MLKAIILEWNNDYGANQVVGEKDMSQLTVKQAHKKAKEFVESLQEFKQNKVIYNLQQDDKILAYIPQ